MVLGAASSSNVLRMLGWRISGMLELYDKMNSANSLLIALGFLEEMLALLWRRQFRGERVPRGSPPDRYKRLLDTLHVDLGSSSVLGDAFTLPGMDSQVDPSRLDAKCG